MPDLKQSLRDFVATSNSGKYSTEEELLSKFPELQGYDIQSLKDFVATSNSGKYGTEEEVLSKFPEFGLTSEDPLKKKEQTQLPTQGNVSGTMGLPSESTSSGSLKPFNKNALLAKGLKQTTIATPLESAPQNRKETEDIANLRTPTNLTSLQAINNAAQEKVRVEKEKLDLRNQIFTYQTLNPETKGGGYAALENIILDPNQSEEKKLAAQKQKETVDKYFELKDKTKSINARIDKDETTRQKGLEERYSSLQNTQELARKYTLKALTGTASILDAIGFDGQEDSFDLDKLKFKFDKEQEGEYSGDSEAISEEKKQNIKKINAFADSLINQETPKGWEKLFEGEWSLGRAGYVTSQAIGQLLPTVAAGFLGGGGGLTTIVGAGLSYEESYNTFEKAGLTDRQSEIASVALSIPLGILEKMGISDIVTKPVFKLMLKETTAEVIAQLAKKELTNKGLFEAVKNTFGQKIKEYGKDLFISGIKEPLTEIEQALLSEAAGQTAEAITGKDSNKDQTMAQYLKELGLKVSEEGFYGLVGGVGMSAVTSAVQNQANPTAYGRALELKDDALMSDFKKQLDREVKKGIITQEQAVTAVENVHKIQAADNQIPSTIEGNERRSMTATLIQIKQALKNEIEGKDKSLTGPTQAAIADIDVKLNEIATGEDTKIEQVAPKGEGILANPETTTAALEALPLEEKTTATFKDTNGDTVSILGNEKKLSDLFHEAQSTPEDNRTEFQQSIIDTVEVSLKTPLDLETEVSRLESEFGLDKQTITEADIAVSQLSDNEQVTETVTSLDDVPVQFRDRVTVNKTEGTPKRKRFFGIPYGKEVKGQTKETYTYTATGKEIKSAYAATKQQVGAAPTTDTGVSATNKSSLDNLKSKTTDAVKLKVVESAQKAIKTLQSVMPNFDIVVHEDEGSYNAAVEKTGGKQNTKGNFNAVKNADGTYSGRIDINLSRASTTTVAHEVAHGIMLQAFGDKPALFKEFRNKISTVLKQSTNQKLIAFADQYKTDVTYEEYLAELTGLLEQEQANISPTTLQRIAAIINKLVSTLSAGQVKVFEDLKNTKDVIDFFSNVSQAIKGGEAIQFLNETQAYGEGLAIKVPSDFVATKSKKLSAKSQIGDYVIPSEYVGKDEFDVLKLGEVPVKNLTDLIKQYEGRVVIITSDATGYGVDSDNEPILGGYGFANNAKNIEDGIGFASLGVGTVKGAYTAAEKAYGQGKTLVLIMIQPPHTTINNSYGAKYLMRAMQQLGTLSPKKLAEAKESIKNFINNSKAMQDELKAEEEAAEEEALAIKEAKEKGEEIKKSEAGAKRRTSKVELFKLIDSIQPNSNLKELTDAYLNCTTFNTRKYIGMGVLSEHKDVQTNEKTTKSKLLFREVGATIYDFLKEYGDQSFLTEDMMLNNVGGFTVGGFELDVTSVEEREKLIEEIQTKGILHPLFNGKLPGTNHFILDGVYDVQENFGEFARPEKGIDMSTQLDKVTAKERKAWFDEFITKKDATTTSGIGIDRAKFKKEYRKLPKKELKEEYFIDKVKPSFQNGLENIVRDKMSRKYFEKLANGNKDKLNSFYLAKNRDVDPSKRTYSMLSASNKVDFKDTYLAPRGLLKDVATHVPTKVAGGIGFIPQEGAAERMAQTEFKKSEKLTQQKNDKENNAGVQSNLGKGQESKQAKSNKGAGKEKTSTGRNVQAYEEEVTALEQSFPINKSQVDAWHGSPHLFDKFTTEKIGTGEGAQAFGWGLYFTDVRAIAKNYADKLSSSRITIDGIAAKVPMDPLFFAAANEVARVGYEKAVENNKYDLKYSYNKEEIEQINKYTEELKNKKVEYKKQGLLYNVTVHQGKTPEQYNWLEWDKPLTNDQRNKIIKAIENKNFNTRTTFGNPLEVVDRTDTKGIDVYKSLAFEFGDKKASLLLLENGIDGVKYPTESISRGTTSDTARGSNYVVFDENAVTVNAINKSQEDAVKTIDRMVRDARGQGFSEEAIAIFLERNGFTAQEIEAVMDTELGASKQMVLSEETMPGFDKMMAAINRAIKKDKALTTVPNKDILSRIMKYLAKQDTYKNATDIQKEKLVRDINKIIGIREKVVKNLSTTLEQFERYEKAFGIDVTLGNIVDPNNITMTEKELLIKQIKDYARGARDVKAAWVKASAELTKDIKNMMKTGKISVKQAASIVRRFGAVNVFSEKSIGKFVDYMTKVFNDAEYVNQLSIAQKTKKAIASLSKNQDRNANLRELGKKFTEIDPSMVDDIYKYNTVAAAIYEAIYGSKLTSQGPKFAQTINIESVSKYVDEMVESQNKKLLDEKIAEIQELLGIDASKFTPQEIKALLENTQTIKKSNEVAIKDSIKKMFGIYSTLIKETISRGTDLFTGEPRNFTKQQKELIGRFMAMDLNNLNAKQSLAAVDSLINFFQNDSTAKMEAVLSDYTAMENTKTLIDKNIKSLRLNKWFSDDFGKLLAEQTYNLPMLFERMFKGVGRGAYVQKMSGLTKLINKKSLAVSESNAIVEEYVSQFYKKEANGEAFNTSENNVERGIAAFMMRTFVGSEEKMQTEFDRRKKLVEQTIDVLSKGNDEEKVKGELYQKVYEKFKKAENIQDVMDATDKVNLEAIQFWQNAWGDKFDKLADVSLNVYNKVLNKELNYIPDNLRKLASNSKTTDLQSTAAMNESSFHHNNNSLYDTEAGVLQTPSYPTELPTDDKNNRTNRVVDFSFDSNNANSMYDALVDVNTAAAVRQVDTFINGDDFNKIFNMEDGEMLKDRIEGYVRNIRSRNIYSQDEFSKFAKALNKVAAIGVGQALAGPTQTLKQVIPVAFNTLVNAQNLDVISSLNSDFQTWLGESGYAIGTRGVKSQADIESLNKLIKEDAKTGGKKTLELVLKANEWWLQTFLVSPDVYIAKASWKSYYEKYLKDNGLYKTVETIRTDSGFREIETKGIDYSSHTLNEDAADYAQRMVDRQQNVSDADLNGFLFTNKEASRQILVKIFMPFANFRMNQAARLGSDINVLTSKTSTVEDRRTAALSLSGFAVEMAVFKMLSGGLVYLFGSLTKWLMDDDENKEERKKRKESIIKGQATSAVADILSPAPLLDPILQYGAAYALAQTQRMLKTKEKDVVSLYEPKVKTIAEQYGLFGIPLIRAAQLGEMTMLAYNGIYKDEYGRERKISKNDQELIGNMIPLALLTNIGLAPVEVNTVMRNTIKFAKKGSKTIKSVDREKSNDYGIYDTKEDLKKYDPILYEEKFGKNSENYLENEEERKAKKEERDLKRAEKDAKYGYVPKAKP